MVQAVVAEAAALPVHVPEDEDVPIQEAPVAAPEAKEPALMRHLTEYRAEAPSIHRGTAVVRRVAYGMEHEQTETIDVPLFATKPAMLRVGGGATLNIGGMQFVRVDVHLELPCYPVMSEVERAYDVALEFVERKLGEQADAVNGQSVAQEEIPLQPQTGPAPIQPSGRVAV